MQTKLTYTAAGIRAPKSAIVQRVAEAMGIPVIDIKLAVDDEPVEVLEAKADLFFYERSFD